MPRDTRVSTYEGLEIWVRKTANWCLRKPYEINATIVQQIDTWYFNIRPTSIWKTANWCQKALKSFKRTGKYWTNFWWCGWRRINFKRIQQRRTSNIHFLLIKISRYIFITIFYDLGVWNGLMGICMNSNRKSASSYKNFDLWSGRRNVLNSYVEVQLYEQIYHIVSYSVVCILYYVLCIVLYHTIPCTTVVD